MWGPQTMPDEQAILDTIPGLSALTPLTGGGQKVVVKANHVDHGVVVVKLFRADLSDERLRREIEAVERIALTNVPAILCHGTIDHAGGQTAYLLEPYVDGEPLSQTLARDPTLPTNAVVSLLDSLLVSAVQLESHHLVHRDIKPDNILVGADGTYWLLDFGIARHLDKVSVTNSGAAIGPSTPGYAPPEQFSNHKRDIDIRADLFAIGVVAYEALSGTHPFREGAADQLDVYRRTATVDAAPLIIPGDSQRQLAGFIAVLISKHPSRRPATAAQAREWFDALRPTLVAAATGEEI